jgi:signal transduction histidine kinase/ligand-binding sensor domain-containing protein/CheY-like chemotaxis protein/AraC-like DNA-binding protein
MPCRIAILIILLLMKFSVGQADISKDDLFFRAIRLKDGLSGSTISTIKQDEHGFIWIGTNDGLCRFDGSEFKIYRHEPGSDQSLSDNFIQNLFFDGDGKLWVMTAAGLDYLDLEQQKFSHYYADGNAGSIADNSPTDIVEMADGKLYISSFYQGISIKDKESGRFTYLNERSPGSSKLSSNWISDLELIDSTLLFVAFREHGIDVHNLLTGKTTNLDGIANQTLSSYQVNVLLNDADNGIWIGTTAGLSYFNIQTKELLNFDYRENETTFLTDNDVMSLFIDDEGFLWIGTRNSGLVIVNKNEIFKHGDQAEFISYKYDYDEGSISYRSISSVFQDKNKYIWLGTHGGGINFVENKNQRFAHLKHVAGVEKSLSYNKVWGITQDKKGNIWIGTDGDGVNVWNCQTGDFSFYKNDPHNNYSLSSNAVISALSDSYGAVWLGTYEGGLNRYNPETGKFYRYKAPEEIPVNDIRCIYEDDERVLWVGMNQGGVARYNRKTDGFEVIRELQMYDVRCIRREDKFLWLGTFGEGLVRYNLENSDVKVFLPDPNNPNSISSTTIFALCQTSDSILWLGTRYGGISKMNIENEQFKRYSEKDGLANNTVHSILKDKNNNLWMSTNNGISKFDLAKVNFTNYSWSSGVQSEEFHNGSGLVTSDGLLCFGGINGLNYFDPDYFQESPDNTNIHFTGLKILNENVLPQSDGVIEKSIEFGPEINLNRKHTVFTIEFRSLRKPFSEEVYYEYFLENYDEAWNSAGKLQSATYRNLPPGEYKFRVKVVPDNSEVVAEQATLMILMSPPFWRTWWSYLLYLGLFGLIVILIFRYRVKQYKIRNRLLYEQRLRGKEKKLHDERLDFFTNISHELRTPLTILSVAIEDLYLQRNLNSKFKKALEAASSNSNRLMELINRLLEFRQTETGVSSLKVRKVNLNAFIPDFLHGFREMAKHNEVNLKLTLPINDLYLWVDADKLNMILNNLLSNAFKHTPSGGHILLGVDETDTQITFTVEDNGEGIAPQLREKIFKRYFKLDAASTSTGIGLALTKSLVELHLGEIEVESKTGKGATFIIKFLKGANHFSASQLVGDDAEPEAGVVESEKEEQPVLLNSKKKIVLIIDDNEEILELLNDKLKEEYQILKARNGAEGKKLALKHIPDLIISDIMMPELSGTELCSDLKNESSTSHIPIILLTAKGSEEDEIRGLSTGADDYISKPFKVSILRARIQTILENRVKLVNYFGNKSEEAVETPDPHKARELAFLKKVEQYILDNYLATEISVFDLASELGYSRTTLYRKIKMLTGQSINSFVRSVKLKKSVTFITEGMNVSEAAYSTGFNDLKYFRESFKKLFGKNPSEFKN